MSEAPAAPPGTSSPTSGCHYFDVGDCRSCVDLPVPYGTQVEAKMQRISRVLAGQVGADAWLPPVRSPRVGFRNKAKLAVGGTLDAPTLGITSARGVGIDLRECLIHDRAIWAVIPDLSGFITHAGLEPYDVTTRAGDLKFVIVTANPAGHLMVRFVLRDEGALSRLRAALPALLARLPQIDVVSANLHPEHKAVLEGDTEVALAGPATFAMALPAVTLHLRHRSFFQTNTAVAGALYAQAASWADELGVRSVLDLYCGVGGFALHLAAPGRRVHGVEIEPSAVESARLSAREQGHDEVTFAVADAAALTMPDGERSPDLVVVNPPRRGIETLAAALESSSVPHVVYSSCNPQSLAADLAAMPSYRVTAARLFDMFAHTEHAEVAVLLRRRDSGSVPASDESIG